jgi:putative drug exporter of the RND superfamily
MLVPALSYDIGRAIWWPSKLSRSDAGVERATETETEAVEAVEDRRTLQA